MGLLTTEVVREYSVFASQAAEWDRLAAGLATPLLHHDWFLSCAETLHEAASLLVVQVRRDGALVAAAPLAVVGTGAACCLEILGTSTLYEPSGLLYEDESSLRQLCRGLAGLSLPLMLQRIPSDGPIPGALAEATEGAGWWASSDAGESLFLEWESTWDDYLKSRSSHRRYDLRRARRRLGEHGRLQYQCLAPDAGDLDALLYAAFEIEASGWKARAGSAIAHRPAIRQFFSRYARRACSAGQLRLCFLKLNDVRVATEIAIEAYGRYWVLKIGYDERWANGSPGLQLLIESVHMAHERGVRNHEFLGNAERWIRPWANGRHSYRTFRYYPRNSVGVVTWARDQALRAGGRLRSALNELRVGAIAPEFAAPRQRPRTPGTASGD